MSSPLPDKDITEFYIRYDINEEIGQGRFSVVKRCTLKSNRQSFAMKIVKKTKTSEQDRKYLKKEIDILRQLDHRNIVRIHDYYTDTSQLFLVIDYLSGGDLFEEITERSYYTERDASVCIQQILEAVAHCHNRGIVHRDLKPENLLLVSQSKAIWIKVVDFGLAIQVEGESKSWFGFAGTLSYLSPEIINREDYGRGIDIWACGVILYILLCGYPPFSSEHQPELFASITSGSYEFHCPEWDTVTPKGRDVIQSMLVNNQDKRPTASALLSHVWIRDRNSTTSTENRGETISALKRFTAKRKLKNTVHSIMAINRGSVDLESHSSIAANPTCKSPLRILPYASNDMLSGDTTVAAAAVEKQILDLTQKLLNTEITANCDKSTEFLPGYPCILNVRDKPLAATVCSAKSHKHSILKPVFHTLSPDAVCIAYVCVCIPEASIGCGVHRNVRSFKETRVWQRTGTDWICLHCHTSEI